MRDVLDRATSIPENEIVSRIYSQCVEEGGCLIWTGYSYRGNQPRIKVGAQSYPVRRLLYEDAHGPVPKGKRVACTCGVTNCVLHFAALTVGQIRKRHPPRAPEARRAKIAEHQRKVHSKLTREQAQDIRYGDCSVAQAAEKYGISVASAWSIRAGTRWKDYSNPFAGLFSANDSQRARA